MAHYLLLMRPLRPLIAFLLLLPSSRCSTSSQVQVGIDGSTGSPDGSTGSPAAPPAPPPGGAMDAVFENELNREVDVYWVENAAREVKIMSIPAGASKGINTFDAHAFFFSEVGAGRRQILKTVIMKHGEHKYALTQADAAQGSKAAVAAGAGSSDPGDACKHSSFPLAHLCQSIAIKRSPEDRGFLGRLSFAERKAGSFLFVLSY